MSKLIIKNGAIIKDVQGIVLSDTTNLASANYSVAEGLATVAAGDYSHAGGYGASSTSPGEWSRSTGIVGGAWFPQYGIIDLAARTTSAAITEIFVGGITNSRISLAPSQTMRFNFTALAVNESTGASKEWSGDGLIKSVGATTSMVGSSNVSTYADASMAAVALGLAANNTNDAIYFEAVGLAATNIRWYVKVDYIYIV